MVYIGGEKTDKYLNSARKKLKNDEEINISQLWLKLSLVEIFLSSFNLIITNLEYFRNQKKLVLEIYNITKQFPSEEKYILTQQIRRAALSVHLNISEGFSRKSKSERKRFFEVSRGSLIEIDTAIDLGVDLFFVKATDLGTLGTCIISCFTQLCALIRSLE